MEQEQNQLTIPLAIVVAGALIAGAIYFGGSAPTLRDNNNVVDMEDVTIQNVSEKDHYLGVANAKIVIAEYSDTECPFCKIFHYTLKDILATYGSDVAWVYRHFPIQQLHPKALKEAEATECATELGGKQAFWRYLDKIFETTNSNDSLNPTELTKIASALGIDTTSFNNCLSSGKYSQLIETSIREAVAAGARGTPYSVLLLRDKLSDATKSAIESIDTKRGLRPDAVVIIDNDKIALNGNLPKDLIIEIIDALLK